MFDIQIFSIFESSRYNIRLSRRKNGIIGGGKSRKGPRNKWGNRSVFGAMDYFGKSYPMSCWTFRVKMYGSEN